MEATGNYGFLLLYLLYQTGIAVKPSKESVLRLLQL